MGGRGTIRIGIDTGGTFTDIVAVEPATGRIVTTKTHSTPDDPSIAFMRGIAAALRMLGADADRVESVRHGTTVATNRLLQGAVQRLGQIHRGSLYGARAVRVVATKHAPAVAPGGSVIVRSGVPKSTPRRPVSG